MDKVRNHLKQFVDWDQLYFYNVKNKSLTLAYMDQRGNEAIPLILKYGDGISLQTALDETITLENERSYWSLRGKSLPDDLETILALPIKDQEAVKGVLTIASTKQKAYRTDQIMIIEIIANMLAIALTNVQYLEKTKRESHFCPLTNLYNFRFFEQALKDNLEETKQTSLILLDLDHFKKINDTYGHQSGNDVLIEIASRLTQTCPNEVVARYGGEEFVILLPNQTEEEAYQTGLKVQKALKQDPIIIQNDLTDHKPAEINVTASIGIASTEQVNEEDETTLDAVTLIRRADRAMYNGAKQQGRDKVASFSGLKKGLAVQS
ncbi:diguanylate cyclase [Halalkalibacter akibai JCM 9157]|uniref:Diguanylate cyclase n=2 Tax=Halalkalibacter akibai TaxID=1411 RepID=W4QST3_HALA3|nr:diguanylate cyclase [Halalkalibacter akibai JCM 9157]